MNNREQFIQKMKAQLDQWSIEIDKLTVRTESAQAEAKRTYQAQLDVLKRQREAAKLKLHELQSSSEDAWESVRESMDLTWESITKSIKDAMSHFK